MTTAIELTPLSAHLSSTLAPCLTRSSRKGEQGSTPGSAGNGGRVVGTLLRDSDYAAMARALGAHGERVEDPADLPDALGELSGARLRSSTS